MLVWCCPGEGCVEDRLSPQLCACCVASRVLVHPPICMCVLSVVSVVLCLATLPAICSSTAVFPLISHNCHSSCCCWPFHGHKQDTPCYLLHCPKLNAFCGWDHI